MLNVSVRFSNADKEGTNILNIFLSPPPVPDLVPHTSGVSRKGFRRDTISKPGSGEGIPRTETRKRILKTSRS
jgi:hypothetical protein